MVIITLRISDMSMPAHKGTDSQVLNSVLYWIYLRDCLVSYSCELSEPPFCSSRNRTMDPWVSGWSEGCGSNPGEGPLLKSWTWASSRTSSRPAVDWLRRFPPLFFVGIVTCRVWRCFTLRSRCPVILIHPSAVLWPHSFFQLGSSRLAVMCACTTHNY